MKYLLITLGVVLISNALIYFIKLPSLLSKSYEFTDFGYGILAGKFILLLLGITLFVLGIKKKKKSIQQSI